MLFTMKPAIVWGNGWTPKHPVARG